MGVIAQGFKYANFFAYSNWTYFIENNNPDTKTLFLKGEPDENSGVFLIVNPFKESVIFIKDKYTLGIKFLVNGKPNYITLEVFTESFNSENKRERLKIDYDDNFSSVPNGQAVYPLVNSDFYGGKTGIYDLFKPGVKLFRIPINDALLKVTLVNTPSFNKALDFMNILQGNIGYYTGYRGVSMPGSQRSGITITQRQQTTQQGQTQNNRLYINNIYDTNKVLDWLTDGQNLLFVVGGLMAFKLIGGLGVLKK